MAPPFFIIRRLAVAASPASRPRSSAREKWVIAFGWSSADYQIRQTDEGSGKPVSTGMSDTGPWRTNSSVACRPGQTSENLAWQHLGPDSHICDQAYTRLTSDGDARPQLVGTGKLFSTCVIAELGS